MDAHEHRTPHCVFPLCDGGGLLCRPNAQSGAKRTAVAALGPPQGVIRHQNYNSSNYGHEKAVEIEAGDSGGSEGSKQPPANDRADDSEDDIHNETLTPFIH